MKTFIAAALIAASSLAAIAPAQAFGPKDIPEVNGPAYGPSDLRTFDGPAFGPSDLKTFDGPAFGPADVRSFEGPARGGWIYEGGNQR